MRLAPKTCWPVANHPPHPASRAIMRRIKFLLPLLICIARPAIGADAPAPALKSIAVLDLVNRNSGDGFDWLGKGLADMLIADLTASKKLTVVDRERTQEVTRELELDRAGLVES